MSETKEEDFDDSFNNNETEKPVVLSPKKKIANTILNSPKEPNINKSIDLSYFQQFTGFFNKKFTLTHYKKEREDSRSMSKSPERIHLPHQIRGNGIPKDNIERLKFLNKTFLSEKFLKSYNQAPKRNDSSFEDFCNYIVLYSKRHNLLDAIILTYYFICHEVKYDYYFQERNEDFKTSQQADSVYENGLALSLGFTNIFEAVLKKLDIRFKHIEGHCKYFPTNDPKKKNTHNNSNNISNNIINMYTTTNTSINLSTIQSKNKNINVFLETETDTENINDYINHCWDAFYFKGDWYLVDVLMGSGSYQINDVVNETNQQKSQDADENFNFFYLMPSPNYFVYSHFPSSDDWQMADKIWTFKQFLNKRNVNYGKFFKGIVKYEVELLTHPEPFIQITNKEILIIKMVLNNFIIEANLFNVNGGNKLNDVKYSFDQKTKTFILEPVFTKVGEFVIRINLRALSSTDLLYRPLLDYRVKVTNALLVNHFEKYNLKLAGLRNDKDDLLPKIGNSIDGNKAFITNYGRGHRIITDYTKVFPSKSIKRVCYDNEGFWLLEPRTPYLKKGVVTKFRVRIKGAINVSLLDGNHLTYLRKTEDDVYEGQRKIENDNVSICCLKGKNVFTEVFRFRPRKNKYALARSQAMNHVSFKNFK